MQNNNLIKILKTFSRKEMTRFWEFTHSPYHNKHKELRLLIDYLNDLFPAFIEKKTNRKYLYKRLFKNEAYNQNRLALLFTYGLRLLEKFLSIEQYNKEGFQRHLDLLRQLRSKELYTYYEKKLPDLKTDVFNNLEGEVNNYALTFQMAKEKDLYFNQLYRTEYNRNLEEKQAYLDLFYFSEKLKDACEMKFRSQILKSNFDLDMVDEVIGTIENHYFDNPSLMVYVSIYKMLNAEDTSLYYHSLKIFNLYEQQFSKSELQNIYNYLQNYCIKQINQGKPSFLKELFNIYNSQMERGLLLVEGYLPEFHFKNMVTTGLRLNENEWAFQFIKDCQSLLKPSALENAYSYNLAAYYYNTKQLEKVLDLLIKVEYTDIRYNLDAKSLLLRTYFDLEEEEAFLSLTEAFRQFLKRNRLLSEFQKAGYYNLIKFSRKVFQIKSLIRYETKKRLKEDLEKIKFEIKKSERVFNKGWLQGKINELFGSLHL